MDVMYDGSMCDGRDIGRTVRHCLLQTQHFARYIYRYCTTVGIIQPVIYFHEYNAYNTTTVLMIL